MGKMPVKGIKLPSAAAAATAVVDGRPEADRSRVMEDAAWRTSCVPTCNGRKDRAGDDDDADDGDGGAAASSGGDGGVDEKGAVSVSSALAAGRVKLPAGDADSSMSSL